MKKFISLVLVVISFTFSFFANAGDSSVEIYHRLGLQGKLDYLEFAKAYDVYRSQDKISIMTVVDKTKAVGEKRLFVIDMKTQTVLYGETTDRKRALSSLDIYHKLGLKDKLDYMVFVKAYDSFKLHSDTDILTVIDYSKHSGEKRLFVFDMKRHEMLYNTWVAHGINSGGKFAKDFSNVKNSRKTSLGVYKTDDTYYGGNGYSLRLDGLTPGKNDKARERYIVVHGADYASKAFIKKYGALGRSWGCPALPVELAAEVIDTIKGGSIIYAHG